MKSGTIWVIGPIAWDTVLYVPQIPTSGRFLHATSHQERAGGQGFNVASGVASAVIIGSADSAGSVLPEDAVGTLTCELR